MATQTFLQRTRSQDGTIGRRKLNKVKLNLYLDVLLTLVFIVEMEEHFTGLALHEVLGLLFAAAFVLHIILHWDWIVSLTRSFFKRTLHESRVNYVLNVLLFVDMVVVSISGILISRTLGLNLTLGQGFHETLRKLHLIGSELVLVVVALHVAMHWKWIKAHSAKYLFNWVPQLGGRAKSEGVATNIVPRAKSRKRMQGYVVLVAIVSLLGAILWSQGDLISPMQNTRLIIDLSASTDGFAMVGEAAAAPTDGAEDTAVVETAPQETSAIETPTASMTMETFIAELTAAGVDVEAVTATMTEGGRSLDNLLAVVNSGRVSVEELAARLKGEAPNAIDATPLQTGTPLLDIRWEELGSVAYDLWVILAVTAVLIVVARPVGWLVKQIKQA